MSNDPSRAAPKLAGVSNFRSLGGMQARDGRRIKPFALMRSDRLCDLTEADWRQLAAVELATICDLRSPMERERHPNRLPAEHGLTELYFDITNDLRGDTSLLAMIAAEPSRAGAIRLMEEIYRRFPRYMASTLRSVTDLLLTKGTPVLIHCAAGKDRTGFAVAMLLHALGIPRETIYEDYLASRAWAHAVHRNVLAQRLAGTIPAEAMDDVIYPILAVEESYLDASIASLTAQFGSIDQYLELAAGLDSARMKQLRDRVLA